MKLPSLLRITETKSSSSSPWPWPSCHQPKTHSFRATTNNKTINSDTTTMDMLESSESLFTVSPPSVSFSTASEQQSNKRADSIETVIRGLRSDRLFFEPDETSSILEAKAGSLPFKDSVVLSLESQDPYLDFRKSMEEMVTVHGVKDWESLQELMCWYLRVNEKSNHGYIVGAFVDLLVGLAFAGSASASSTTTTTSSSSTSHSPSSPLSFYSSSLSSSYCSTRCVSCLEAEVHDDDDVSTPSSSLLLEQVREEINHEEDVASSSSSSNI